VSTLEKGSRPLCRACLDWSERRHHLAGGLGAALLDLFLESGWAARDPRSRAVVFGKAGLRRFEAFLAARSEAAGAAS
jgi:hypothetical protein